MILRVDGVPVPQGSVRAFAVRKAGVPTGRVAVTGDNPQTKSWRQSVIDALPPVYAELTGPVMVHVVFLLPRPARHYGTGKNKDRLRPGAPPCPAVKPDLDKLCRAVLDALTDAQVWRDDAQVVHLEAAKRYAGPGERPGAVIKVGWLPMSMQAGIATGMAAGCAIAKWNGSTSDG